MQDTEHFTNNKEHFAIKDSERHEIEDHENVKNPTSKCGSGGNCKSLSGKPLLPIMDPRFNMREICKEIILLSTHLCAEDRSCIDCISKHGLTIEALAEEGISLDKEGKYRHLLEPIPKKCRQMLKDVLAKTIDPHKASQEFRTIRKKFMPLCITIC